MPAPNLKPEIVQIPLKMVGGTHFGRYGKISNESTWNFIVSDGWLVPYAGYANSLNLGPTLPGRGIYSSYVGGFMIVCIGSIVARVTANVTTGQLQYISVGNLATGTGDVYIAENNNQQIVITDGVNVYVYNYATGPAIITFQQLSFEQFPFYDPGYISFQGGQLIIAIGDTTNWVLSGYNDALTWSTNANSVGSLQTKPDFCQAVVPIPGGGVNVLVFGRNVVEQWQRVGTALFPFQRTPSFNIDYGCLNPASIAHLKNYVVWLAVNEQSGPVIMLYQGGQVESISTDGIDYQLGNLTNPENCTGFLFQQDGHVLYQFTFPDDNISYAYDFETKMFFNVTDENLNYHIAREVVYFNNNYYFVALNRGDVFEFSTLITFAQYDTEGQDIRVIPRIRMTPPLRLPDQRPYIARNLSFTIENGQLNHITNIPYYTSSDVILAAENGVLLAAEDNVLIALDKDTLQNTYMYPDNVVYLAISRNGGETFGNLLPKNMNNTGNFYSRFIYQRLGRANDSTYQIRFVGLNRFVATDGIVEIYQ